MKYECINRRFTEIVSEWLAKGYVVNTATMGGSQGEVAKIDLTNGKEIIRIEIDHCGKMFDRVGGKEYSFDGLRIVVGMATDEVRPNEGNTWATVWSSNLEILYFEEYYKIGDRAGREWWGTKEESMAQQDKHWERYRARYTEKKWDFPDGAKKIVLPFVRRQPKCASVRLCDIEKVTKHYCKSRFGEKRMVRYVVTAKGKPYTLRGGISGERV